VTCFTDWRPDALYQWVLCSFCVLSLSGTTAIMDIAIVYAVPTPFMNDAFMNMNQEHEQVRRTPIVINVSARDRLAPRICKEYNLSAGREPFFARYGGATNATGETRFEAQTCSEIRSGTWSGRVDFFTGGRCISSGRTYDGCGEGAYRWTGP
jgi:hypothetical protein